MTAMENFEIVYTVLRAVPDPFRGDALCFGLVIWVPERALVFVDDTAVKRLAALGPNYRRWNAVETQRSLQDELDRLPSTELRQQWLQLFVSDPAPQYGRIVIFQDQGDAKSQIERHALSLLTRLVRPPAATLPAPTRVASKRATKLATELRDWLKGAKAYSSKVDDIGRGKVVANYPIDPAADLYADFAVLNGKLNAIETLDLRGIEKLTPSLRGDAALKGITLDHARTKIDGKRVVVLSATDYNVARPAIQLISRYADDVLDMHDAKDRQQLADFIAGALHRDQLPGLTLHS
jgi:hypothetical protein